MSKRDWDETRRITSLDPRVFSVFKMAAGRVRGIVNARQTVREKTNFE